MLSAFPIQCSVTSELLDSNDGKIENINRVHIDVFNVHVYIIELF